MLKPEHKDLITGFVIEFCNDKGVYKNERYKLIERVIEHFNSEVIEA